MALVPDGQGSLAVTRALPGDWHLCSVVPRMARSRPIATSGCPFLWALRLGFTHLVCVFVTNCKRGLLPQAAPGTGAR